jgi:hypothetical protein
MDAHTVLEKIVTLLQAEVDNIHAQEDYEVKPTKKNRRIAEKCERKYEEESEAFPSEFSVALDTIRTLLSEINNPEEGNDAWEWWVKSEEFDDEEDSEDDEE